MSSRRSAIPSDSLLQLRQRLDRLPPKALNVPIRLPLPPSCMVFQSRRFIALFT
ncbi:integrase, catalytic region, partial [Salmonella enterica subsp. enterica serovar Enteritidis str. 561362 9-7]